MKENTTIKLFDKHAGKYDEMQPILVPHYDDMIDVVSEAYGHHVGKGTFLDLGCGTGNLSKNILKRSPESKVFLLDGSQAMIDVAANKICKKFGDEVLLGSKAINLEEKEWNVGITEKFDAIVTSFVLEHLKEADYRSVVKKCNDLLKPDGVLLINTTKSLDELKKNIRFGGKIATCDATGIAWKELGVPITFSADAHHVSHLGAGLEIAREHAMAAGYKEVAVLTRGAWKLVGIEEV